MSKYEQLERKLILVVSHNEDARELLSEIETATAMTQIDSIERSQLIDLLPLNK